MSIQNPGDHFPTTQEHVDRLESLEHYLPKGFPEYLFQGTSTSNSDTVQEIGLRGGSMVTSVAGCMDDRFYRGRFLVSRYDDSIFEPEVEPFVQYAIKEGTAGEEESKRKFVYNAVDTDSAEVKAETTSTRLNGRENLASFDLTLDQKVYLQMLTTLMRGGLCGVTEIKLLGEIQKMGLEEAWNEIDADTPDVGDLMTLGGGVYSQGLKMYFQYKHNYPKREAMAKFLNLDISVFISKESLREALNDLGEDELMNRLIASFPGEIDIDWNNLNIDEETLKKKVVKQIYTTHIVRSVKTVYENENIPDLLFVRGDSSKGLEELITLKTSQADQNSS